MGVAPPAIDVTAAERRTVLALLERHLPHTTVWAYGSRVRWTSRPESDLDLVAFARPEQSGRVAELREAFDESDLPFAVDLFVWDEISEGFRKRVEAEYLVLTTQGHPNERRRQGRWRRASIEEIAEKVAMGPFGSSIKVDTFTPSGVPIISGQHLHGFRVNDAAEFNFISEEHAERLRGANVQRGDVIFTHRGNIGQVACISENSRYEKYVVSQSQFYLRPRLAEAIPEFITAYFKTPQGRHDLLANTSQVGVPSIAKPVTYLRSIEIPVPPLSEQRAIAHVLGTLDDRIELNRRMSETLEAMARALFKSWFVDFDPVRAKMEGRDTGLPKEIADLFPDRLVDSELRPIPEGWSLGKLHDIASLNPESWNARNAPGDVAYVDLANTKWGHIETVEVHPWSVAPSRARRVLRPGDTIVGTVRPGNGSYALIGGEGLTGSTGFAVLRPRTSNAREIVWCAATSRGNIDRLAHLADGGAYPAVHPHAVAQTRIVLSDASVRRAFSSLTAGWFDRMENNKRASRKLAAMRDALLEPLVSGESRVRTTTA